MIKIKMREGILDNLEFIDKVVNPYSWSELFEVAKRVIYCFLHTAYKHKEFIANVLNFAVNFNGDSSKAFVHTLIEKVSSEFAVQQ